MCTVILHVCAFRASHLNGAPSLSAWTFFSSFFDLICTTCFQVLHTGDGNINEMPKRRWLAGRCEEKCLLSWSCAKRRDHWHIKCNRVRLWSGQTNTDFCSVAFKRQRRLTTTPTNNRCVVYTYLNKRTKKHTAPSRDSKLAANFNLATSTRDVSFRRRFWNHWPTSLAHLIHNLLCIAVICEQEHQKALKYPLHVNALTFMFNAYSMQSSQRMHKISVHSLWRVPVAGRLRHNTMQEILDTAFFTNKPTDLEYSVFLMICLGG